MAFPEMWTFLQSHLTIGETIENWTINKGVVGDPFEIESVTQKAIVVNAPGARTLQNVSQKDFARVYELWDNYVRGMTPRTAFHALTRKSKYVISILHWAQEKCDGRLP